MAETLINCEFFVEGMHCAACELLIEDELSNFSGVKKVNAKLAQNKVFISAETKPTAAELSKLVAEHGYKIADERAARKQINWKELGYGAVIAGIVVGGFLLLQKLNIVNWVDSSQVTLPFVFLIGVIASLSTCMAVVGGLVLSLSSSYAKERKLVKPMIAFHLSRLIGFFFLGGVIGLIGSAFILTTTSTFILSFLLFLVMLIMGINLLDIIPAAKRMQLKMPKFIGKYVLKIQGSQNVFTPILLGIATFILPCGFTQSMQLYSLTTGSFVTGAITMFIFALGTFPMLSLISFASVKLSKSLQSGVFFKAAGLIILFFAVFNFISALVAVGLIAPVFN